MMYLLRSIISELENAGVRVVLVHSPRWTKEGTISSYRKPILHEIRDFAASEQISFLAVTLENTPVFKSGDYFFDTAHLNADGARVFSEIVAGKIAALAQRQFDPVCDAL